MAGQRVMHALRRTGGQVFKPSIPSRSEGVDGRVGGSRSRYCLMIGWICSFERLSACLLYTSGRVNMPKGGRRLGVGWLVVVNESAPV